MQREAAIAYLEPIKLRRNCIQYQHLSCAPLQIYAARRHATYPITGAFTVSKGRVSWAQSYFQLLCPQLRTHTLFTHENSPPSNSSS